MIISDTKQKLIMFMYEKQLSQKQVAQDLGITQEHLSRILADKYDISNRVHAEIEALFKGHNYSKALDDKKRL